MVAAMLPAPRHLSERADFDYRAGHLSQIVEMPYHQFSNLPTNPQQWNRHLRPVHPDEQRCAIDDQGE